MTLEEYMKVCPSCKMEYEANRLNQKFCSMKCKARYNNGKAKREREKREAVVGDENTILWKNRELLKANNEQEHSLEAMEEVGFKFGYLTCFELDNDGINVLYCYDYGYRFSKSNTHIKIFKK